MHTLKFVLKKYKFIHSSFENSRLFASLKKQVMTDCSGISSCSIAVEAPAILFPFFNCPSNILMVANFHAFPFRLFHLHSSLLNVSIFGMSMVNLTFFWSSLANSFFMFLSFGYYFLSFPNIKP